MSEGGDPPTSSRRGSQQKPRRFSFRHRRTKSLSSFPAGPRVGRLSNVLSSLRNWNSGSLGSYRSPHGQGSPRRDLELSLDAAASLASRSEPPSLWSRRHSTITKVLRHSAALLDDHGPWSLRRGSVAARRGSATPRRGSVAARRGSVAARNKPPVGPEACRAELEAHLDQARSLLAAADKSGCLAASDLPAFMDPELTKDFDARACALWLERAHDWIDVEATRAMLEMSEGSTCLEAEGASQSTPLPPKGGMLMLTARAQAERLPSSSTRASSCLRSLPRAAPPSPPSPFGTAPSPTRLSW